MREFKVLCEKARACKDGALLASPYVTFGTLKRVLDSLDSQIPVIFISSFMPEDVAAGSFDKTALARLWMSPNITLLRCPALHAKYFRFDDYVLFGSANLTDSGMGISRFPNIEILSHSELDEWHIDFENHLLRSSWRLSQLEYEALMSIEIRPNVRDTSLPLLPDSQDSISEIQWLPETVDCDWLVSKAHPSKSPLTEPEERDLAFLGINSPWSSNVALRIARIKFDQNNVLKRVRSSSELSFRFGEIRSWVRMDFPNRDENEINELCRHFYSWVTGLFPQEFQTDVPHISQILYKRNSPLEDIAVIEGRG